MYPKLRHRGAPHAEPRDRPRQGCSPSLLGKARTQAHLGLALAPGSPSFHECRAPRRRQRAWFQLRPSARQRAQQGCCETAVASRFEDWELRTWRHRPQPVRSTASTTGPWPLSNRYQPRELLFRDGRMSSRCRSHHFQTGNAKHPPPPPQESWIGHDQNRSSKSHLARRSALAQTETRFVKKNLCGRKINGRKVKISQFMLLGIL